MNQKTAFLIAVLLLLATPAVSQGDPDGFMKKVLGSIVQKDSTKFHIEVARKSSNLLALSQTIQLCKNGSGHFLKDYRRDFCEWSNKIPIDTPMEDVKTQLPDYIQVDWQNPQLLGHGSLYPVTKIKGHKKGRSGDFLGFVNDLYSGHVFIK